MHQDDQADRHEKEAGPRHEKDNSQGNLGSRAVRPWSTPRGEREVVDFDPRKGEKHDIYIYREMQFLNGIYDQ